MFRRFLVLVTLQLFAAFCFAQESYIGLYIQDQKIGYSYSASSEEAVAGRPMKKFVSRTVMNAGLLGQGLQVLIDQTSWSTLDGKPSLVKFEMQSGGRSQKVEANYIASGVTLAIDNNGALTKKTLAMPKDAPIVDDALNALIESDAIAGQSRSFYVLDPMTAMFVKNTATLKGPTKIKVGEADVDATWVEVKEPRMVMNVYLSAKGDFIKAVAIGGIEMRPITKEEALAETEGGFTDLAEATRIAVDPPLGDPAKFKSATYQFMGGDFARAPSDAAQSIRKVGSNWIVKVTPAIANTKVKPITILQAAKAQPKWVTPSLHIPAKNSALAKQAASAVGKEKGAVAAARKIGAYVHSIMRPNAGIGVLRDATEVMRTREGVCRDYAILTATLLRAAKIPARVASGLVYHQDSFYYHAWVESWDGKQWYGIDTTRPNLDVTPGHIKLAGGSVEDAFLFTFIEKVQVRVIAKTPKVGGAEVE